MVTSVGQTGSKEVAAEMICKGKDKDPAVILTLVILAEGGTD